MCLDQPRPPPGVTCTVVERWGGRKGVAHLQHGTPTDELTWLALSSWSNRTKVHRLLIGEKKSEGRSSASRPYCMYECIPVRNLRLGEQDDWMLTLWTGAPRDLLMQASMLDWDRTMLVANGVFVVCVLLFNEVVYLHGRYRSYERSKIAPVLLCGEDASNECFANWCGYRPDSNLISKILWPIIHCEASHSYGVLLNGGTPHGIGLFWMALTFFGFHFKCPSTTERWWWGLVSAPPPRLHSQPWVSTIQTNKKWGVPHKNLIQYMYCSVFFLNYLHFHPAQLRNHKTEKKTKDPVLRKRGGLHLGIDGFRNEHSTVR